MSDNYIKLYPSNWLYNAGVVGLIRLLEELGENVETLLHNDGSAHVSTKKTADQIFQKWVESSPKSKKGNSLMFGYKDAYYANQTEKSIKQRIEDLISTNKFLPKKKLRKAGKEFTCCLCQTKIKTTKGKAIFLNQAFGNVLLGSAKSFSNMYWNNSARDFVCPKCEFILMCHHLGFTSLQNLVEAFINAPSFMQIYQLNKFLRETFSSKLGQLRDRREILAMSVIEYALKSKRTLGFWTAMNIEIVNRYRMKRDNRWVEKVEFFSLSYDVLQLISDRYIAAQLSEIGEFKILNLVLNQEHSKLIQLGYRLLKIALNDARGKREHHRDFINDWIYLERNKRRQTDLQRTAERILRLYALIEQKQQRSKSYGSTGISTY